jgi:CYTH domain-containing protein
MESVLDGHIQRKVTQKFCEGPGVSTRSTITNIYLSEAEYKTLEALGGNEILKDRYIVDIHGQKFGNDVFRARHEGLILAECEAESEAELQQLSIPAFCVLEVTADVFFTGGALSAVGQAEFERRLAKALLEVG